MSNIPVRRDGGVPAPRAEWEPGRWFRDLLHFDPFREMAPMFATEVPGTYVPAFEVKETKEAYLFSADLPGVKEEDLEITITGNVLSITGKRVAEKEEKGDRFYAFERSYGTFTRAFTLPEGVDLEHVRAEKKDGVLTLAVAKLPEALPKKIQVRPAIMPKV